MTASRDLSTVLCRRGRLSLVLEPRAWLIGAYVASGAVYVCLLPCLPLRWQWRKPVRPGRPGKAPDAGSYQTEWLPGTWE